MQTQRGTIDFCFYLMGVIFDGAVCVGLAMIWVWLVGVASVLELVFKKLESMREPLTRMRTTSCISG